MTMSYPFADRVAEDERLFAQGQVFDPLTRRLLEQAGLMPGMRVLDLGSGAGNVARLAAELVGPHGAVVGVNATRRPSSWPGDGPTRPTSSIGWATCRRWTGSSTASTR